MEPMSKIEPVNRTVQPVGICVPCPRGMDCSEKSSRLVTRLATLPGWWRQNSSNPYSLTQSYPCPFGSIACPGGDALACNKGYQGVACAVCEDGYFLSNRRCNACSSSARWMLLVVLILVPFIGGLMVYLAHKYDLKTSVTLFKIVFGFMQVTSSMDLSYELSWPSPFSDVIATFRIALLDLLQISSFGCYRRYDFYESFLLTALGTLLFMAVCGVLYAAAMVVVKILQRVCNINSNAAGQIEGFSISALTLIMLIIYPAVSIKSLQLFNCVSIEGQYYLDADYQIVCSGPLYTRYALFNAFFILMVPIGWPVFLLWYLRRVKDHLQDPAVEGTLGHVYRDYKLNCYWWEVEELVRKLLLSSVVAFFAKGSLFQVAIGSLISNCALLLHIYYRPYRKSIFNQYAGTALFVIWLTHLAASVLQARPDTESYALAVLLVLCNVAVALGPALVAILFAIQILPESVLRKLGLEKSVEGMSSTESTKDVMPIELQSTTSLDLYGPNHDDDGCDAPGIEQDEMQDKNKGECKVVDVEPISLDFDVENQSNDECKVVEVELPVVEENPTDECKIVEVESTIMPCSDEKKAEPSEVEMTRV
eukprot:TRINITY_DN3801_c0_g1_i13.p1 TRINITY_DN3801_c0_g1~~TRINITY_DN3801_c0_g1_i13.p1  ORF type:complete len:675 (+),score=72.70 TRINITY_DN3801_c0_g1_i13:245-2026(+)